MAVFTGWILILIGLALAGGGGWLVVLGGSAYYLLAALGFLATGTLMILRRPGALWIYALLILGTGLWSVWEVGLDWWALMPRGAVIVAIGLWLMAPWVTRGLNASGRQPWGLAAGPLAVMVVAAGALALAAVLGPDPNGVRGEVPPAPRSRHRARKAISRTATGTPMAAPVSASVIRPWIKSPRKTPASWNRCGPTTPATCAVRVTRWKPPTK
jgi:glucose dehydrogenase